MRNRRTNHSPLSPGIAVVTGAGGAIGGEIARHLCAAGLTVAAIDTDRASLTALAGHVRGLRPFACDVRDPAEVRNVAERVARELGAIGLLVNAAGVPADGSSPTAISESARDAMDVNFFGTLHWIEAVLPSMLARANGRIVNIASLAGLIPCPGMAAYASSKAALVMYSQILRSDIRVRGVHVACVCPPAVRSPLLTALLATGCFSPRALRVMKPLEPAQIARAVMKAITNSGSITVPSRTGTALWHMSRMAPAMTGWLMATFFQPNHQ